MSQSNSSAFQIENGTLIKYTGDEKQVNIPSYVKRIAPYAFQDCKNLVKVATPVRLVKIGKGAFFGCDALEEVIMPGGLYRRIRTERIFSNHKNIYFRFYASNGLESEEDYEDDFDDDEPEPEVEEEPVQPTEQLDSAEEQEPEEPVEEVEEQEEASTDVEVGQASTLFMEVNETEDTPGQEKPEEDKELTLSELDGEIPPEEVLDETLEEKMEAIVPPEIPIEELSVARKRELMNLVDFLIEETTLVKYVGTKKQVEIPEFITRIGENAFANSSVTDVYIPEGVVYIGKCAFTWCENIKKIELPKNLQLIEDLAFANCTSLEEIVVPDSVKFIGESAFHACSAMKKAKLSSSLQSIGRRAFDFCIELRDVIIPDGIKVVCDGAFAHCEGLKSVYIPSSVTELGNWAFSECYSLTDFNLPSSLERIGDVAFMECRSLKRVDIPSSVEYLGRQCFVGCTGLLVVTIPAKLRDQVKPQKAFRGLSIPDLEFIE
ncbi:MAG: leucine-rich repeat protein [Candidatus Coproplasma sp.]